MQEFTITIFLELFGNNLSSVQKPFVIVLYCVINEFWTGFLYLMIISIIVYVTHAILKSTNIYNVISQLIINQQGCSSHYSFTPAATPVVFFRSCLFAYEKGSWTGPLQRLLLIDWYVAKASIIKNHLKFIWNHSIHSHVLRGADILSSICP